MTLACTGVWWTRGWWRSVCLLLPCFTAAVLQLHTGQNIRCTAAKSNGRAVDRLSNQLQKVSKGKVKCAMLHWSVGGVLISLPKAISL